jgi:hypothetical protein
MLDRSRIVLWIGLFVYPFEHRDITEEERDRLRDGISKWLGDQNYMVDIRDAKRIRIGGSK